MVFQSMSNWITAAESKNWPVAMHDRADGVTINFGCNATDFLVKLLSKQLIETRFFPDEFPSKKPVFVQPSQR